MRQLVGSDPNRVLMRRRISPEWPHGRWDMTERHLVYSGAVVAGLVVFLAAWPVGGPRAQQSPPAALTIDANDIGGVVTGRNGPEAGVWVIAETTELGTRFA